MSEHGLKLCVPGLDLTERLRDWLDFSWMRFVLSPTECSWLGGWSWRRPPRMAVSSVFPLGLIEKPKACRILDLRSMNTDDPTFQLSTLHLSYFGDLGDGTGDSDGDGCPDEPAAHGQLRARHEPLVQWLQIPDGRIGRLFSRKAAKPSYTGEAEFSATVARKS